MNAQQWLDLAHPDRTDDVMRYARPALYSYQYEDGWLSATNGHVAHMVQTAKPDGVWLPCRNHELQPLPSVADAFSPNAPSVNAAYSYNDYTSTVNMTVPRKSFMVKRNAGDAVHVTWSGVTFTVRPSELVNLVRYAPDGAQIDVRLSESYMPAYKRRTHHPSYVLRIEYTSRNGEPCRAMLMTLEVAKGTHGR